MKVHITDDAIKYLQNKNVDVITIDIKDTLCWLSAGIPEVYLGKSIDSKVKALYDKTEISNITVYYYTKFDTKNGVITVSLSKFLFMKSLELKGIEMY